MEGDCIYINATLEVSEMLLWGTKMVGGILEDTLVWIHRHLACDVYALILEMD